MKLYGYSNQGMFTGEILDVSDKAPIPKNYTYSQLPEIPEGKFAQFDRWEWRIIDDMPPKPEISIPKINYKTILTLHEFRTRFTFVEKVAIKQSTDAGVMVIQDDLMAAQEIDLENQELIDGIGYLVVQGLLTTERAAVILTAEEMS